MRRASLFVPLLWYVRYQASRFDAWTLDHLLRRLQGVSLENPARGLQQLLCDASIGVSNESLVCDVGNRLLDDVNHIRRADVHEESLEALSVIVATVARLQLHHSTLVEKSSLLAVAVRSFLWLSTKLQSGGGLLRKWRTSARLDSSLEESWCRVLESLVHVKPAQLPLTVLGDFFAGHKSYTTSQRGRGKEILNSVVLHANLCLLHLIRSASCDESNVDTATLLSQVEEEIVQCVDAVVDALGNQTSTHDALDLLKIAEALHAKKWLSPRNRQKIVFSICLPALHRRCATVPFDHLCRGMRLLTSLQASGSELTDVSVEVAKRVQGWKAHDVAENPEALVCALEAAAGLDGALFLLQVCLSCVTRNPAAVVEADVAAGRTQLQSWLAVSQSLLVRIVVAASRSALLEKQLGNALSQLTCCIKDTYATSPTGIALTLLLAAYVADTVLACDPHFMDVAIAVERQANTTDVSATWRLLGIRLMLTLGSKNAVRASSAALRDVSFGQESDEFLRRQLVRCRNAVRRK